MCVTFKNITNLREQQKDSIVIINVNEKLNTKKQIKFLCQNYHK